MRPDLKRAVELVRKGMSYSIAAKQIGITRNAVAGACSRAGVKRATPTVRIERSAPRAIKVAQLLRQGLAPGEVARRLGIKPNSIRHYQRIGERHCAKARQR